MRAQNYLRAHAERQFDETCHVMTFPRAAGFTGKEKQSSDLFVRAVLACVLLDVAELMTEDAHLTATLHDVVRREADYVARSKLKDREGGWSYFPDLPELPPDVDSLSAALHLFARAASSYTTLCDKPIALTLDGAYPDGSIETWIISPTDPPAHRKTMMRGVREYWGAGADVDVCASFYHALLKYDRIKHAEVVATGAQYVLSQQCADGSWNSSWYWPQPYGIGLCVHLLREVGIEQMAVTSALAFLAASQRRDGGWGVGQTVPLDTALALWVFALAGVNDPGKEIRCGIDILLDYQTEDGSWDASPWIKMPIGRASGTVQRLATYQSAVLTTAFCLRSLLLTRSWRRN